MEAELSSAYKQLNDAQSEYSNTASLATQNLNEVLETIEKNTSKVKAFIDIARTHTNHYFKNHTERECAQRLGMSQQAIHERKKRILKKIKNNLDEEGC